MKDTDLPSEYYCMEFDIFKTLCNIIQVPIWLINLTMYIIQVFAIN